MTRLRRFAIAVLAAATVTMGSLASAPAASAMEMTCKQRETIATGLSGTRPSGTNAWFATTHDATVGGIR